MRDKQQGRKCAILPLRFLPLPREHKTQIFINRPYSIRAIDQEELPIVAVCQRLPLNTNIGDEKDLLSIGVQVIGVNKDKKGDKGYWCDISFGELFTICSLSFDDSLGCFVAEALPRNISSIFEHIPPDQVVVVHHGLKRFLDTFMAKTFPCSDEIKKQGERLLSLLNVRAPSAIQNPQFSQLFFIFLFNFLSEQGSSNELIPADIFEKVFLSGTPQDFISNLINLIDRLDIVWKEIFEISKRNVIENERKERQAYLDMLLQAVQREYRATFPDGTGDTEIDNYLSQIKENKYMPEDLKRQLVDVLRSVQGNIYNPERQMLTRYVSFVISLPWGKYVEPETDINKVEEVLNKSHYGLVDVKERVIEYLGLYLHLSRPPKGNILCFVGLPGTGKTSFARAVADALKLPFQRISLGGVGDEAEIKGHRRTYVAAMPGRIAAGVQQAGALNAIIFLDEVDKLLIGYRGRPDAALLDVLDPDHNHSFLDHYVDYPIDLSNILFICGANSWADINPTLRDRMEFILFPSYTLNEKIIIAKDYFIPRLISEWQIPPNAIKVTKGVLEYIGDKYCRYDAGVRLFKQQLETLIRKALTEMQRHKEKRKTFVINRHFAERALLPPSSEPIMDIRRFEQIGQVPILSVLSHGGRISWAEIFLDSLPDEGKRDATLPLFVTTSKVDPSFMASLRAAYLCCRQNLLKNTDFNKYAVYVHLPETWLETHGSSASAALAVGMYLTYFQRPWRHAAAVTGEISSVGDILPVGGLIEKIIAADSFGFTDVFLPKANRDEILVYLNKRRLKPKANMHFVSHIQDILNFLRR